MWEKKKKERTFRRRKKGTNPSFSSSLFFLLYQTKQGKERNTLFIPLSFLLLSLHFLFYQTLCVKCPTSSFTERTVVIILQLQRTLFSFSLNQKIVENKKKKTEVATYSIFQTKNTLESVKNNQTKIQTLQDIYLNGTSLLPIYIPLLLAWSISFVLLYYRKYWT